MTEPAERGPGWLLGRVHGIPVYLGRSWPVVGGVIVLWFGPTARVPGSPPWSGYVVAFGYALLLLLSVFAHEASHAAVARWRGLTVDRVAADLWGGHTAYDAAAAGPGTSATIAIAGPLANAVLAAVGWILLPVITQPVASALLGAVVAANLLVAAFNLLPGLPLDGGFLLEAAVWRVTGSRATGMVAAGWAGRLLTLGVLGWFLAEPLRSGAAPSLVTVVWLAIIGAFLWVGATHAIRAGHGRRAFEAIPLASLVRPVVVLPSHASAQSLLTASAPPGLWTNDPPAAGPTGWAVLLGPDARPAGFLDRAAASAVPPGSLTAVPASSFLLRTEPGWIVPAHREGDAWPVVQSLLARRQSQVSTPVLVVDPDTGRPVGTVSLDDLSAAVRR